ncbi:MAG: hypothetical protein KH415_18595 [Clostridium sp.]|nr:hypothetical protein [Clostridium sp.]
MGAIEDKIRRAIFGREVRDSIADGIEVVEQLREDYDRQVINAGNSNAEIVDARGGEEKLKDRLDKEKEKNNLKFEEVNTSLEQKINLNEDIFYNEINIEKKRDEVSGTTYWVTSIPHLDKNGNIIKLKTGVSEYYETHPNRHEDDGTGTDYINNPKLETARNFSIRKKATLVINGGTWGNQGANGNCVVNGEIKASVSEQYRRMPLGIKTDNTLVAYDYTTTAQQNLDDGSIDVVQDFIQ